MVSAFLRPLQVIFFFVEKVKNQLNQEKWKKVMKNQGAHILKWGVHILKKKHVFISLRWIAKLREFLGYKKDYFLKRHLFFPKNLFFQTKKVAGTHIKIFKLRRVKQFGELAGIFSWNWFFLSLILTLLTSSIRFTSNVNVFLRLFRAFFIW